MKANKLALLVIVAVAFMASMTACNSSSSEGETAKPQMSEETKARFQPKDTAGAGAGTAEPERSGAPTPPPPGN
jgi:hypothetical protein